jgi:hypothetical protein
LTGLVPVIHVLKPASPEQRKTWVAGTSPAKGLIGSRGGAAANWLGRRLK